MNLHDYKKKFYQKRKMFFIYLIFVLISTVSPFAQQKQLHGTVSDENSVPLIGVSVAIKGTSEGTASDTEGKFELATSMNNPVLVFSYLGYKNIEISAEEKTDFTIKMTPDIKTVDEVVVVGYGTQKKISVTGSVSTVNAKDLERTTSTTTAATLAGKIPGITFRQMNGQPGQTMNIEIRNLGAPLFIIDGVMKDEGQFNNLDINDIESISIIKDGAAAIYGIKASNGVVLVTTKRGSQNEKPTVKINAYYGIQNWTSFPKMSDAYSYASARSEASITTTGTNDLKLTQEDLEKYKTGYYNPQAGEDYRSFDWYNFVVHKNAPQKYLSVSTQGGSDKINYYLAISRMNQEALFYDFQFDRKNIQANIDANISKYLKVGATMNGRLEERLSPAVGNDYNDDFWNLRWGLNRNHPTERPYANDNPNYLNATTYVANNQAYARRDIIGAASDLWRVFQGNWNIDWTTPVKGLKLNGLYSYYIANEQVDRRKKEVPFYTYDYNNKTYTQTATLDTKSLVKKQHTIWENMYRFSAQYDNKFGVHSLSAILVAEATERFDRSLTMENDNISDNFQVLFPIDQADQTNQFNKITEDYWNEYPTAGYIGRINYNYNNRYLLEFAGRYDGSFKFPKDHRWGFFPSVSAGWRISEENFFKNNEINKWMSNLKLRLSYGKLGDDANSNPGDVLYGYGDYDHLAGYQYGANTLISQDPFTTSEGMVIAGLYQKNLPVTNVTWIKTNMSNVGLDLGFLNNRLSLEMDGFYRKRTGLLATKAGYTLPVETGFAYPPENLNSDMHMGVDGLIKWTDQIKDFSYYAGINATFARKKDGESWGQTFGTSWDEYRNSTYNRWSYVAWGYEVIGRFKTQEQIDSYPVIMNKDNGSDRNIPVLPGDLIYKDINKDGVIDEYDARPIGYAEGGLPYLTFGINLGANWKGFDLALDFAGGTFQSFQQNYETKWPFQANGNTFDFMVNDRWRHTDPLDPSSPWIEGYYPALRLEPTNAWQNYCNNSTYWFVNLKYIRLRNLELGYTLPKIWTQKIAIQQCRFYFSGTNVFTLDNVSRLGLDPENNDTNGLGYPNNKVLTIGTVITF